MLKRNNDLQKHAWPETTYRKISPQTLDIFRRKIAQVDWRQIYAIEDSNKSYHMFLSILKKHYLCSFSMRTYRKQKKLRKPWITYDHIKLMKQKKNRLSESFFSSRRIEKFQEFKIFRNKINRMLKKSKGEYYSRLFDENCLRNSDIL